MKLSEELQWRGFVQQSTFQNMSELDDTKRAFYFGVDPSADSMTIGNLASAMMVRHFIEHGHTAYLLVGGATGMIGDPDGKTSERTLQSFEQIDHNKRSIARQYQQVFAGNEFTLVDNYDWFKTLNYLDFLRQIGKNVPLSQMLGREFVQSRLGEGGSGISYAEFSYSLIQAYDFLHLYRTYGVTLQLCGADQWGNSVAGIDLIRRLESTETHVYSIPLVVNKSTGVKFGKSEAGAVWLDESKTSVYQFYQFWLNVDDLGVIDYLKIYTLLDKEMIDSIDESRQHNPADRLAQRTLAFEVTKLVHGQERVESVMRVTGVLFGNTPVIDLTPEELTMLAAEIPTVEVGTGLVDALVTTGLAGSNGEARRLIEGGAINLDGQKATADTTIDRTSLVRKGKNSFLLVR